MLPQDPKSLFVKKTVLEDLQEMTQNEQDIRETAEICQITSLLKSHPYDLSGGEQQRAALAKVLLTRPQLLLLDEPTKGIDSFFKETFASILTELKKKGITIVMVSHDVEFCARYADQVSMFFDGQVLTTDTDVYKRQAAGPRDGRAAGQRGRPERGYPQYGGLRRRDGRLLFHLQGRHLLFRSGDRRPEADE